MSKSTKWWVMGVLIILFALFSLRFIFPTEESTPIANVNPSELPGIQVSDAPWEPEISHLRERLAAIGLPALATEGTAFHIHQHIDIFINGEKIPTPADIGVNEGAQFISALHTHVADGIIHIESDKARDFTLGQFFDIWGVRFTDSCLGSYCNDNGKKPTIFSNGKEITNGFRSLVLEPHQEIVVVYGSLENLPAIPSSYAFAPGL